MQPFDLFEAIFEMYNLLSVILSDRPELLKSQRHLMQDLKTSLKHIKHTFTSKRTNTDAGEGGTAPNKRSRKGQGGNTGNVSRRGEHVYHDHQVVDAFTRAGYKLVSNDEDEFGFAPINEVKQPSTMSVGLN
jgi:hypothetical protein